MVVELNTELEFIINKLLEKFKQVKELVKLRQVQELAKFKQVLVIKE